MLRKDAKIELLKQVPLFAACSKRELGQIASLADELNLPGERELTREGAPGHDFVVIVEGRAEVVRADRVISELGPGDFVGEIALVTGGARTATVRTRGPARVLVIAATGFRALMHDVASIEDKVLSALVARLPPGQL